MVPAITGFDWDAGNIDKCQKHGVSLPEIEAVFRGWVAVFPDLAHSDREKRFHAIGRTESGRYIFLVFALRGAATRTLVRPISARYMHQKEIRHYEKIASGTAER